MSLVLPVEPMEYELRAGAVDVDGGVGAGVREGGMVDLLAEEGAAALREPVSGWRGAHEDARPAEKLVHGRGSQSSTSRSALQAR